MSGILGGGLTGQLSAYRQRLQGFQRMELWLLRSEGRLSSRSNGSLPIGEGDVSKKTLVNGREGARRGKCLGSLLFHELSSTFTYF